MPPDKSIPGSVQDWLVRAKGHLALATQPKPAGAFWEDQCFLAQQAAEKALKAVYQHRGLCSAIRTTSKNWAKVWKTMAYPYHPLSKRLSY
jgi:HEPN domain